ncbi:UNVERIFIED_CONTAM: Chaperone protein dnaJ 11, chloroplastic [Sesamum angustifolium]|uniref:Chaperone protein dnaJ 11, chloroplastic n=1 Tax=Sesamum angustifolium TaxID=2727405 RepID=A0AAW2L5E0_9LAMI
MFRIFIFSAIHNHIPNQTLPSNGFHIICTPESQTRPKFSAIPPPHSPLLRVSASYATAERISVSRNGNESPTAYEVLGIQTGATCQEIKSAYRNLARVLHPDVAPKYGDDGASSADEFMRVHAAYATLSDPDKRAVYDKSLFLRRRSAAAFRLAVIPR